MSLPTPAPKCRPHRPVRVAVALTAASLIAGCGSSGSSSPTTSTVAQRPTTSKHASAHATHTRSNKGKHTQKASSKKHAKAVALPATHAKAVARPAIHSKQPVISAGAVTSTLSGTGNQAIGNLSEKTTVVLEWSAATPPIQIFNPHGFLLVNSSSATGRVRLARGEYTGLRVASKGHWTLQVRAS